MLPWNLKGSPSILQQGFNDYFVKFSFSPGRAFSTNRPRASFLPVLSGTVFADCLATYLWEPNIRNWLITPDYNFVNYLSFWYCACLSQVRHCGCQVEPRAFITLPSTIKSEHLAQQDANSTWKSCLQYFLPSNSKNIPSFENNFPK